MPDPDPTADPAAEDPAATIPPVEPDLAARLATLERERADEKALAQRMQLMGQVLGGRVGEPLGAYFASTYSGDLTVEAVTEAAQGLRIIAADGVNPLIDPNTQAGFDAALDLRAGAIAPGAVAGPHPNELADQAAAAARKIGTAEDAMAIWVETQSKAIHAGDRRNVVDPRTTRGKQQNPVDLAR